MSNHSDGSQDAADSVRFWPDNAVSSEPDAWERLAQALYTLSHSIRDDWAQRNGVVLVGITSLKIGDSLDAVEAFADPLTGALWFVAHVYDVEHAKQFAAMHGLVAHFAPDPLEAWFPMPDIIFVACAPANAKLVWREDARPHLGSTP